ncbi:degV family protein [Corynebacterium renale]|uniref:DegV family protein with EDD domain n=1 Tax=Corynebacterium renale TaxID=1724 RepID=A0A2A9DPF4_9CORY|nr:DegV family protein [Corynebacterium renale]PFG28236.1 DegV family protein with EDD domain [Corynebacterium renale]SQG65177.1 degV family protein [Corynebacterium renale]SQI19659.1 degV family protein [Corynebacterium renale]STC98204.1 degV family protein [Corynebacterium renale]
MPVRVVTDSSSGLPAQLAEDLGITVIDLHVMDGEEGRSTSGLSALELCAAYARQLERGGDEGVVALHLSRELSSTWSAADTAAAIFDGSVRVIDSGTAGMTMGAAAMAAAKIAADGATLDEVYAMARDTLDRSQTWLYLNKIDDLRKSGRISATTAMVSAALATKPIMTIHDGKLELAAKTRTQTKAFSRLVEMIVERAGGEPAFVAIQDAFAPESAHHLQDILESAMPSGTSYMRVPLTDVLAVHTGTGALGISVVFSTHPDDLPVDN